MLVSELKEADVKVGIRVYSNVYKYFGTIILTQETVHGLKIVIQWDNKITSFSIYYRLFDMTDVVDHYFVISKRTR